MKPASSEVKPTRRTASLSCTSGTLTIALTSWLMPPSLGTGELRLRPGIEGLRIRLVSDHPQRAGLRAGAVERALRPAQRFHPLDVDEPRIGTAAALGDRLLIEIKPRRGHGPELEAGARDATEHDGRAAGLAIADRQARDEPRVVVHLLQAPDRDGLGVERGDRLRNILQAFRAACRGDDHLLQHAFGACATRFESAPSGPMRPLESTGLPRSPRSLRVTTPWKLSCSRLS